MTAIVDYGVGNLFSLHSSLLKIGEESVITADPAVIAAADRVILPGVGAFRDAAEKLRQSGLIPVLEAQLAAGKPVMGICLGMQLLFEKSFEYGEYAGLGWLKGEVRPIGEAPESAGLKIPHMGWNALRFVGEKHPLFRYVAEGECVYFVHSYRAVGCEDILIASAEYGCTIPAAVGKGSLLGCQFHPEKSGETGLRILRAFCELREGEL